MKRRFMHKIYNYVGQRLIAEIQSSLCRDCNIINKQAPRHQISDEKIDLVDLGRIKAFMFMDDLIYDQFIAESAKHYDIRRIVSERLPPYHRKNLSKVDSTNVIEFVSHHYVANGLDFTFIDVGCNNGADALAIADFFPMKIFLQRSLHLSLEAPGIWLSIIYS